MHMNKDVYVFEASELKWPPGKYPRAFGYADKVFHFVSLVTDRGEDVLYWNYLSDNNIWAKVYND